ncbi:MAG: apolipoprotein N-acyltransferase [Bacteroidetes bacterium]|nr:apolipoprotein N-acyltransferase [Bacteroidota bacterium]
MKFRKSHLILLSLLSGAILSLGWPERGFPGLLFVGFVPLLFIEDQMSRYPERFVKFSALFYTYPGFFLWNLLTTWWIVNSTFAGAAMAIVLNSLFMSIVFQAFHWTRKRLGSPVAGYAALVSYWVAFEYLHLNWDLNWPWLNLGNGFATYYKWVQWYEYTGAIGGTVWVLVGNILAFILIKKIQNTKYKIQNTKPVQNSNFVVQYSIFLFFWLSTPIILSYYTYANYKEQNHPVKFVVVQPNIDPYNEQYNLPPQAVIGRIMSLAAPAIDSTTSFLVAPESAIQEDMWENELSKFTSMRMLTQAIAPWPRLNMLVGASTHYQLAPGEPVLRWARKFTDTDGHYYAYNTAIMLNSRDSLQLYHKSKLTPGVEILPSFKGFKWLENFAIDLGGTVGSLGQDSARKVYTTVGDVKVSPAICYESIFGEFFAEFVRNGAQVMVIITNDGWWGNTAGHRQHYSFAHLRAIETRRSIARSANTGISAFINQRGDASQETAYWVPAVIRGTLNASDKLTFYVKHGDYIARFLTYLAGVLILAAIGMAVRQKYFNPGLNPEKRNTP